MKCKKCGFVLEEGQKFCNMCGAEQSKIKIKQRTDVRSLFGIMKFSSKNHRRMVINFLIGLGFLVYTIWFDKYDGVYDIDVSAISILTLFLIYVFVQIFMGFKNPESTYTKRYKYILRASTIVYVVLLFYLLIINNDSTFIVENFKKLLGMERLGGFNNG